MLRIDHPLLSSSLGSTKTLTSFHWGQPGSGPKVYIQASLHAEELPGMLVAHHLRALLENAEAADQIQGEIILVPVANPLGLAQRVDHRPMGRFDLDTSENFNRHYPDLAGAVGPLVRDALGADPTANIALVREAMGNYLGNWVLDTELQSLRHRLLTLAHDADFVLDLHCDCEGVLHFYTEEACWPQLEPLARFLGSEAILLAKNSGSGPFDECLSGAWWRLAEDFSGPGRPLPQGCCSTTIELRGELDVSHALAEQDAQAIIDWLKHSQLLACKRAPTVPAFKCRPTPLAGSETLKATAPGLVVFAAEVGQTLQIGDLVAEVIDPIANQTQRVLAGVDGVFYARIRDRYITAGGELGKIAGAVAFRTGELLGA
ncbi:MAG: succinylglutamate desuccinylase/aspartoacylase family protein [Rhodoferax sp.]|uniref:succinylglutamate desuccinylase/aspartoacylase family protein n=1 Tax=Rhodoferax sp. TaxID=50421 RepID=UPI001401153B|nr:succinylglutamate desuccinylase/aspartoacylase family protein [Rhodoferax sp.]NDP39414.1 succinylglutamate desuccinylase/aspartoacylase family protein [Rhodoferax sp.]